MNLKVTSIKLKRLVFPLLVLVIIIGVYLVYQRTEQSTQEISNKNIANKSNESPKSSDSVLNNSKEQKDYILRCDGDLEDIYSSDIIAKYSDFDFKEAFKNNPSFETQLAFALIANNYSQTDKESEQEPINQSVEILERLLATGKDQNLLHYYLVTMCGTKEDKSNCKNRVIDNAIQNDPNNGALWFQVALLEAADKNTTKTSEALRQLIAAPNYDEYYADSIEVFDNALIEIGVSQESFRLIRAIGHSAALTIPPLQSLTKFCRENAKSRADISQLCLDAGRTIASKSQQTLYRSVGYFLNEIIFEELGDNQNKNIYTLLRNDIQRNSYANSEATTLMMFDIELQRYWFSQLKLFGEQKSFQLLHEEAVRLSRDPDYNPCRSF